MTATLYHPVPGLYNSTKDRLDAVKIGALFGLSVGEIAAIVGSEPDFVSHTPDALTLQPALVVLERIADTLLYLAGSPEGLRIWLNTPCPDLAGETPLAYLKAGKAEAVAQLLEATLMGLPG